MKKRFKSEYFFGFLALTSILLLWEGFSSIVFTGFVYFFFLVVLGKNRKSSHLKKISFFLFLFLFFLESMTFVFIDNTPFFYPVPGKVKNVEALGKKLLIGREDLHYETDLANYEMYNSSEGEFNYLHKFNALGLRENEYSKDYIENNNVILGMGDSFTEGVGSHQDSTWVKALENNYPDSLICINAGTKGSDLLNEYYKLKTVLYKYYDPSIVVVTINSTDINDYIVNGGFSVRYKEKNSLYKPEMPSTTFVYTLSPLFRVIAHSFFNYELCGSENRCNGIKDKALKEINATIEAFERHAHRNNYLLYYCFIPLEGEILESNDIKLVFDYAMENNCKVLDFFTEVEELETNRDPIFWKNDGHYTPKGYEILGNFIYTELNQK